MPLPQPNANDGPPRALIISSDEAVVSEVTGLIVRELPGTSVVATGTLPAGNSLAPLASPPGYRLCLVDMCSGGGAALAFLSEASARMAELPLIALLSRNDPDLILQCLRQGATEFLIRPFTSDQLQAALRKLSRTHPFSTAQPESRAKAYCVMPGKGACGGTTLACNLAYQLKRVRPGKLLLADLDLLTGTLAFVLKLKSTYSFLDALARAASLDAGMWKSIVTGWHGVDVLLSPEDPMDGISVAGDPAPVVEYSRQIYETVVLDVGAPFGEWNLSVARLCDELVLVTTNELPALHATQRGIAYLEANGIQRSKLRLVLNRFSSRIGLQPDEIQTALHTEIFHSLPTDREAIEKALIEGKPALPTSSFGKSVAALASRLAGAEEPTRKSSLWSSLFRR